MIDGFYGRGWCNLTDALGCFCWKSFYLLSVIVVVCILLLFWSPMGRQIKSKNVNNKEQFAAKKLTKHEPTQWLSIIHGRANQQTHEHFIVELVHYQLMNKLSPCPSMKSKLVVLKGSRLFEKSLTKFNSLRYWFARDNWLTLRSAMHTCGAPTGVLDAWLAVSFRNPPSFPKWDLSLSY